MEVGRSPRIAEISWGHIEVEGVGRFKDAKLYPGGARAWDWRETGTDHVPGIQPADIQELLERGADDVVDQIVEVPLRQPHHAGHHRTRVDLSPQLLGLPQHRVP